MSISITYNTPMVTDHKGTGGYRRATEDQKRTDKEGRVKMKNHDRKH